MGAYHDLRQVPLTHKDLRRMIPHIRRVPSLHLTSVLDSEITCTLCGGSGLAIVQSDTNPRVQDCPNCFDPITGKSKKTMKSRTREEHEAIGAHRR